GGRGVAVRRPGVEWPDARQDTEADVESQEDPALDARRDGGGLEVEERERRGAGVDVEREDADENERGAEQEVERELHRGVLLRADARLPVRPRKDAARAHLAGRAPDTDQQIHRKDGELVEQEEDEEIEGHEDAEDAGDERQQERVEL